MQPFLPAISVGLTLCGAEFDTFLFASRSGEVFMQAST
jgi:hypothetical protein